jgi:hypothetical protein
VVLNEVLEHLRREPAILAESERMLEEQLRRQEIFFGDNLLPTFPLPHLVRADDLAGWTRESECLATAIESVAQATFADPELFAALKLRPEAEELIRVDPGYRRITTLSRPDAILREQGLLFVEFNCDSPAMMAFSDAVTECLLETPALKPVRNRLRPDWMTPRLLEVLLDCYREYGGSASPPTIAITDWEGQKTRYEHRRIARQFEAAGYPTIVCDPRAFTRRSRGLEVAGRPVHIVYRRALFTELLERQGEVAPLLDAYRSGDVCVVNSMRSYLASSKTLLALLCDPRFSAHLQDLPSVAHTMLLTNKVHAELRQLRGRYVLKRGESHGGQHVLLPGLATAEQWEAALAESALTPWVAQEYCPVPKIMTVAHHDGGVRVDERFFNWNPFLFNGRYAGSIARAGTSELINISLGGGLMPTVSA